MKAFISVLLIISALPVFSQESYWEFEINDGTEIKTIEFFFTESKYAVHKTTPSSTEYFITDSIANKNLLLIADAESKDAFISRLVRESDASGETGYAYEDEEMPPLEEEPKFAEGENYRLLTEKKQINGVKCQKIELLNNGTPAGYGWVALGIYFRVDQSVAFAEIREGTIVICDVLSSGRKLIIAFKDHRSKIASEAVFSITPPEEYKVYDLDNPDPYEGE